MARKFVTSNAKWKPKNYNPKTDTIVVVGSKSTNRGRVLSVTSGGQKTVFDASNPKTMLNVKYTSLSDIMTATDDSNMYNKLMTANPKLKLSTDSFTQAIKNQLQREYARKEQLYGQKQKLAVQRANEIYNARLVQVTQQQFKISESQWSNLTPFEQQQLKQKYLTMLEKSRNGTLYQPTQPKTKYTSTLQQRINQQINGSSLRQRLTGR